MNAGPSSRPAKRKRRRPSKRPQKGRQKARTQKFISSEAAGRPARHQWTAAEEKALTEFVQENGNISGITNCFDFIIFYNLL